MGILDRSGFSIEFGGEKFTTKSNGQSGRREAAEKIWEMLGYVPINDEEEIDSDFLNYPAGTFREDIWHDIEETLGVPVHELMFPDSAKRTIDMNNHHSTERASVFTDALREGRIDLNLVGKMAHNLIDRNRNPTQHDKSVLTVANEYVDCYLFNEDSIAWVVMPIAENLDKNLGSDITHLDGFNPEMALAAGIKDAAIEHAAADLSYFDDRFVQRASEGITDMDFGNSVRDAIESSDMFSRAGIDADAQVTMSSLSVREAWDILRVAAATGQLQGEPELEEVAHLVRDAAALEVTGEYPDIARTLIDTARNAEEADIDASRFETVYEAMKDVLENKGWNVGPIDHDTVDIECWTPQTGADFIFTLDFRDGDIDSAEDWQREVTELVDNFSPFEETMAFKDQNGAPSPEDIFEDFQTFKKDGLQDLVLTVDSVAAACNANEIGESLDAMMDAKEAEADFGKNEIETFFIDQDGVTR